jgi:hypothetical protein
MSKSMPSGKNYGQFRSPMADSAVKRTPTTPKIAENTTAKGVSGKSAPIQSPMQGGQLAGKNHK